MKKERKQKKGMVFFLLLSINFCWAVLKYYIIWEDLWKIPRSKTDHMLIKSESLRIRLGCPYFRWTRWFQCAPQFYKCYSLQDIPGISILSFFSSFLLISLFSFSLSLSQSFFWHKDKSNARKFIMAWIRNGKNNTIVERRKTW